LTQPPLRILGKARSASAAEVVATPRSRSATLRIAERGEAEFDPAVLKRALTEHGPDAWRS